MVRNQNEIICLTKNGNKMENLKKFYLQLLSGMFLIIMFNSCENFSNQVIQDEKFVNPYEYIGVLHNEGLDYALNIAGSKIGSEISIEDISGLATSFILSNPKSNFMNYNSENYKELAELFLSEMNEGYNKHILEYPILQEGTISNQYLFKLREVFHNIDFIDSVQSFIQIKRLEKEIWTSQISEEDKTILLCMSSVGKNSYSYWKKNLTKYIKLDSKSEDFWKVALEIVEADFEGGLAGFIVGAIIGGVGGTLIMPGVGTVTAAFLEGMQGAVYGAIVGSLLKVFFLYVVPLIPA